MRDVIALCWYVPWLQEGGQVRFVGSASMDGFVSQLHTELRCTVNHTSDLPSCVKLAFHFISWGRCTVKQPSKIPIFLLLRISQYHIRVACTHIQFRSLSPIHKRRICLVLQHVSTNKCFTEEVFVWHALYLGVFTVSGPSRGLAARLQLQVPACRLLEQSCSYKSKDHLNYNYLLTIKPRQCRLPQVVERIYCYYSFFAISASLRGKSHTHICLRSWFQRVI